MITTMNTHNIQNMIPYVLADKLLQGAQWRGGSLLSAALHHTCVEAVNVKTK